MEPTRREFNATLLSASAACLIGLGSNPGSQEKEGTKKQAPSTTSPSTLATPAFQFNYMLPSCMYGYEKVASILPEVKKIGATSIDLWPKPHGNQREQVEELGVEKFADMLKENDVSVGCITQYKLGPFGLQQEMKVAQGFGCKTMVCGGAGPKDLKGKELKAAVGKFVEKMKPQLQVAHETGVTIAIENHANNLIMSPDSLKWLVELCPAPQLAIAFAPYHLEQDAEKLGALIRALGNRIAVFYAWQHGMGCMKKLPKHQELLQMPGRGTLDFKPLINALKTISYSGWTEIFMHPVPRGVPILSSPEKVTKEINLARTYLMDCCQ